MTTPKSIIVHGRKWFGKNNGNTYHTTQIFLDGKLVGNTDIQYGYGDQYVWNAFEELEAEGLILRVGAFAERSTSGGVTESPQAYCKRVGCTLEYFSTDVGRKMDL